MQPPPPSPPPLCEQCPAPLDNILHTFTTCSRVEEVWEYLLYAASCLLGGPVPDANLLFLKFPISPNEIHIIFTVLTFADLVWSSRGEQAAILLLAIGATLAWALPFKSNFKLI